MTAHTLVVASRKETDDSWYGYDCTDFINCLYPKGDTSEAPASGRWQDGAPQVALIQRSTAIAELYVGPSVVYSSFAVVSSPRRFIDIVVAPELAIDVLERNSDPNSYQIHGSQAGDLTWNATPQQLASWVAAAETAASNVWTRRKLTVGLRKAFATLELLRMHAQVAGVNVNAACDAFAGITVPAQIGNELGIGVDELIDVAIAAVR